MIADYTQPELFSTNRTPKMPVDVCKNRHRNSPASVEANPSQDVKRDAHRQILAFISLMGKTHSKAIARELQKPLNAVSGRCSELLAMGMIERLDERIEGCSVLRIKRK